MYVHVVETQVTVLFIAVGKELFEVVKPSFMLNYPSKSSLQLQTTCHLNYENFDGETMRTSV